MRAAFRISYTGGSGNDVVLIRSNSPPTTISFITSLTNQQTQVQGTGLPDLHYIIQANDDLTTTNWVNIGNATAKSSGAFSFTDPNAPFIPQRFYRVLSP